MAAADHIWKFFRAGGFDQVDLATDGDLSNLEKLDPKLWVALSCPASGLEFDQKTLNLIDTDKDGRIRVPEILAAVNYVVKYLKHPADIARGADGVPLEAINAATDDGKALLAAARHILQNLGKPAEKIITAADVSDTEKLFTQAQFNGDGVIPVSAAGDEPVRKVLEEIVAALGLENDQGRQPGVDQAKADAFFAALREYETWWCEGEALARSGAGTIPISEAALDALAGGAPLRAKLDDYFARCRLAEFDARAEEALNPAAPEYAAMKAADLSRDNAAMAALPLQRVGPRRPLNLEEGVNPAWAAALRKFRTAVLIPALGRPAGVLEEEEWAAVSQKLAAYDSWLNAQKGAAVKKLGIVRVREILAGKAREQINELLKRDLALAPEFADIENVTRLVLLYRDLFVLLRNFVNFANFYDPKVSSIFDAGRLYLDQRSCHLCLRVEDPAAHAAIAGLSKMYLAYCDCTRPSGEKMKIVAAFTQGDADYLMVGRHGVFFDRKGKDWDALITKTVENPISIWQSFWSPYKRLIRFVEEQIARFAEHREKAAHEHTTTLVTTTAQGTLPDKPEAKERFDVGRFAGIFAAIGLAIGAIGAALGAMLAVFASLSWWQMPLAIGAIALVVSGPAMMIAWLKLRLRTLGPLLEGNGWAINGRIKVNIPLGASLTAVRKLPANSRLSLLDPFEDKHTQRQRLLLAFLFLAAAFIFLYWNVVIRPQFADEKPARQKAPPTKQ